MSWVIAHFVVEKTTLFELSFFKWLLFSNFKYGKNVGYISWGSALVRRFIFEHNALWEKSRAEMAAAVDINTITFSDRAFLDNAAYGSSGFENMVKIRLIIFTPAISKNFHLKEILFVVSGREFC